MLRSVPIGISDFLGTITVSTTSPSLRTNFTWLPFCVDSMKPTDSSRRFTSRKVNGLSCPNLDLDGANPGWTRGPWRFEVQFESLFQVFKRFFFSGALTGYVEFEALRDVPLALAPDGRGKRSHHFLILSQPC